MVILEAAAVLGLLGVLVYGTIVLLTRAKQEPHHTHRQWRVTHYEASGTTRVVVQLVSPTAAHVLDEHLVATVPVDDPDYDHKFLAAMSTARERRALFETEEGP